MRSASAPLTPKDAHIFSPKSANVPSASSVNACESISNLGQGRSRTDAGESRNEVGERPVPARLCHAMRAAIGELMTDAIDSRSPCECAKTVVTGTPGNHSP